MHQSVPEESCDQVLFDSFHDESPCATRGGTITLNCSKKWAADEKSPERRRISISTRLCFVSSQTSQDTRIPAHAHTHKKNSTEIAHSAHALGAVPVVERSSPQMEVLVVNLRQPEALGVFVPRLVTLLQASRVKSIQGCSRLHGMHGLLLLLLPLLLLLLLLLLRRQVC